MRGHACVQLYFFDGARLLSTGAAPFYGPSSSSGIWFLHILPALGICLFDSSHPGEGAEVFTLISWMTNDVEHPFMCFLAIWTSSFENFLFKSCLFLK